MIVRLQVRRVLCGLCDRHISLNRRKTSLVIEYHSLQSMGVERSERAHPHPVSCSHFLPRNLVKCGIYYAKVCLSVCPSVCHTREPRLNRFKISKYALHHTIEGRFLFLETNFAYY